MIKKHHWRNLQKTFVTGLVVLAPLFVTIWVLWGLYEYVQVRSPFGFYGGTLLTLLVVMLVILAVGWLSRTALGSVLSLVDESLARLPGVGLLYRSLRDMTNAISGEERRFKHPVWVFPIPKSQLKLVGFITREDLAHLGVKGNVAVYMPHSYNISGQLVVVPRSMVKPIKSKSRDLFAFAATGGLTGAHAQGQGASAESEP
jgi:uncharacterized membrane protein